MRLASPSPPLPSDDYLTPSVAIAALEAFCALVDAFGGEECDFEVGGGGGEVKARYWVRWVDQEG